MPRMCGGARPFYDGSYRFSLRSMYCIAVLAAAYLVAAKLGLHLALVNKYATAVWPPAGIALASLLLWGSWLWPGVLIGAFVANITTGDALTPGGMLASTGIAAGNTLEALLGAHLVNRFAHGCRAFDRARDVFRFAAVAALISTTVSATVGVISLSLAGLARWAAAPTIWMTWWIGDAGGDLVFAPALILWAADYRVRRRRTRALETVLLLLVVCVLGLAAFTNLSSPDTPAQLGMAFLCTPALLWAAFRCGQRETAATLLVVSGAALWGWYRGMESGALAPAFVLLELQCYLAVTAVTVLAVAAEVAQRKQAEDAVRESESRLRAFLESAAQGVVAVDSAGNIVLVNAKTEELFGYGRDELLGRPLEILLPEQYRRAHVLHRAEYFARPRARPMGLGLDLAGRRNDGTAFPLEISLSSVGDGESLLSLAFITDISARKRAEERLREIAKLESLGVLAGGIAHDFNNLLVGIMGNASLLLDAPNLGAPERSKVEDLLYASERAANLVRQLLAYAGKGQFTIEALNLSELTRATLPLIRTSVPKSVAVRLALADGLPAIQADSSQIQQLIMNLVINAAEAIGETAGTVTVRTSVESFESKPGVDGIAPGQYVCFEVTDTGCGMDAATAARIFDPFFTTKFAGRGLGLSAALGIVRGHKGGITFTSSPGAGTTFTVLIPATSAQPATAERTCEVDLHGRGTILVVDDEELVRVTAKAVLERFGYTVVVASNGREAVRIFEAAADQISLVVLDLSMPELSGEDTLDELRRVRAEVPVILSSGFNETDATRRFAGKGLAGFVQKPYTAALLAQKVKSACAGE